MSQAASSVPSGTGGVAQCGGVSLRVPGGRSRVTGPVGVSRCRSRSTGSSGSGTVGAVDPAEVLQPVPGAGQRGPDDPAAALGRPAVQRVEHAEGEQVPAAVVEGLAGQRVRTVGAEGLLAGVGHAGGGLDEAVEAAPGGPGADRAVGRQVDDDQAGTAGDEVVHGQPQLAERARPVAVDEHVGLVDEREQTISVLGPAQVEQARALARAGVDDEQVDLGQVGAVDLQDLGPVGGEEAAGHGPGDDPGEVQHPNARQWAVAGRLGDLRVGLADPLDVQRAQGVERLAVGVGQPLLGRALARGAHAGGGKGVLQVLGRPASRRQPAPPLGRARSGRGRPGRRPRGAGSWRGSGPSRRRRSRRSRRSAPRAMRAPGRPGEGGARNGRRRRRGAGRS